MLITDNISFLIINYNTSKLINALIKSIIKFSTGLKYNIVIFDNSDDEKLILDNSYKNNNIIVVDNTTSKYLNFDTFIKQNVVTNLGKSNNYASLKHALSIDYCLNELNYLNNNIVLCDSDILLIKPIDFIDNSYISIGEAKQTWNVSKERLLPILCYLNNEKLKENNIKYFDKNRFIGCIPRNRI